MCWVNLSYDRRVALRVLDAEDRPYEMPANHVPGVFTRGAVKGCHTCKHSGSEAGNVSCSQPNFTAWNGSTTVTEKPEGKPVKLDDGKWYCCDWWNRRAG